MDDMELQRAIYASIQAQRQQQQQARPTTQHHPQPQPVYRYTEPDNRKRSTLLREGILPKSGPPVPAVPPPAPFGRPSANDYGYGNDETPLPAPKESDRIPGYTEIFFGGRLQRQNPRGNHVLLVTEESLTAGTTSFRSHEVVGMRSDTGILQAPNEEEEISHVSLQVQNLGSSRGKYVCAAICIAPDIKDPSFVGLSVHYDPAGAVFVSLDKWRMTNQEGVERVKSVGAPVSVRLQRDRLLVKFVVRAGFLASVCVNSEVLFHDVPVEGLEFGVSRVLMFAAGGKISMKDILIGEEAVTPPPAAPPLPSAQATVTPNRYSHSPARPQASAQRAEAHAPTRANKAAASPVQSKPKAAGAPPKAQPPPSSDGPVNELVARVEAEIMDASPMVQWDDVAGVDDAKRLLNEAVILPILVPELFVGVLQPWKGVLLYGPPGTGKTMLAKAVATSGKTTFFNISASVLTAKHFGESEKMVRTLFEVARKHAPSTIFFDEIDALAGARGGEHDAMRRLMTELLQQMDGLMSAPAKDGAAKPRQVTVVAATNRPWDLDEAIRRRLEKRIYIPLPNMEGRLSLLTKQCSSLLLSSSVDLQRIAKDTEGYSGADLNLLCRDAGMMPLRRLIDGKSPQQIAEMRAQGVLKPAEVHREDFYDALRKIQPSVAQGDLGRYDTWSKEFGSV